jgi:hypothetical protein
MATITTPHADRELHRLNSRLYTELARFTTGLFVGVLALMTFLLSVGLQHPKMDIEVSIYAAIITVALSLLSYVIGAVYDARYVARAAGLADLKKEDLAKATAETDKAHKALRMWRMVQLTLFILSVIAVAAFALTSVQLFFPAAAAAATSATGAQ